MQDQRNDACPIDPDIADSAVLDLLLDPALGAPLSMDEVVRELGDRIRTLDAITRLHGSGLIRRLDEFVFATHAARRSRQLD